MEAVERPAPGPPTVTMVTAPWCRVCTTMLPVVSEVVDRHPPVGLVVVDAASDPESVARLGVRGTPTVIGWSEGREVFRVVGGRGREELDRLVAGLAGGVAVEPRVSPTDVTVRLLAGAGLVAVGLVAPAWPLLAAGAGLMLWAASGWMRSR